MDIDLTTLLCFCALLFIGGTAARILYLQKTGRWKYGEKEPGDTNDAW